MMAFFLPIMGAFVVTIAIIYLQQRIISNKNQQLKQLKSTNTALQKELTNAHIRTEITNDVISTSDNVIDDSMQDNGYYRD